MVTAATAVLTARYRIVLSIIGQLYYARHATERYSGSMYLIAFVLWIISKRR
jgi:hypothetical protein